MSTKLTFERTSSEHTATHTEAVLLADALFAPFGGAAVADRTVTRAKVRIRCRSLKRGNGYDVILWQAKQVKEKEEKKETERAPRKRERNDRKGSRKDKA